MSDTIYIGTGKQRSGSHSIELTLRLERILSAETFEVNGATYIKCIVAKRRVVSTYGHTHTVFVPEPDRYDRNDRLIDEQERQE